jgi:hypothetical protein
MHHRSRIVSLIRSTNQTPADRHPIDIRLRPVLKTGRAGQSTSSARFHSRCRHGLNHRRVLMIHFDGYSVRIEFAVARARTVGPNQAESTVYPAARLVLSPMAAATLSQQLSALLSMLEQKELLKRLAPSSAKKQ